MQNCLLLVDRSFFRAKLPSVGDLWVGRKSLSVFCAVSSSSSIISWSKSKANLHPTVQPLKFQSKPIFFSLHHHILRLSIQIHTFHIPRRENWKLYVSRSLLARTYVTRDYHAADQPQKYPSKSMSPFSFFFFFLLWHVELNLSFSPRLEWIKRAATIFDFWKKSLTRRQTRYFDHANSKLASSSSFSTTSR